MKVVFIVFPLLLLTFYLIAAYQNKQEPAEEIEKEITYGPFTVHVKAWSSRDFDMNHGIVRYTNVSYGISCAGKPVVFPGALQNNTGLPFMWRVYALPGAPTPTLVAGSQSLYLVYEKDGAPVVEPLVEQGYDFASLQFLDSEKGQPGAYGEVFAKNETSDLDHLDSLGGGRYLMVSEHGVLDVQTRSFRQFNINNESIDNYSFPSPHGALAFSPDQKHIVFRANFQSWNAADADLPESEHALVVYDFEKDKGYTVRFDDTNTRLISIQNADYHWFEQYFEWQKSDAGYRLSNRVLAQKPNWTGGYDPRDNYYTLYPVKPGMLPVFLDFVLAQMDWSPSNIVSDKTSEYTGRCIDLAAGDTKLGLRFQEDEQTLSFSKYLYAEDSPEYKVLVKKIADAFNAELSAGKHQEHFGRILSETKKIRGLYQH